MSFSYGKWTKYQMMKEDGLLAQYLPETKLFSEHAFWGLLHRYASVIIKPSRGLMGNGVVKVSRQGDERFEIHSNKNKDIMEKYEVEDFLLKERFGKKLYIVQEAIPLAKIGNSPFDIRVMVEKVGEEWVVTGKFAKLAANGYIITNVVQDIMPLDQAIPQSSILYPDTHKLNQEIDRIALQTAILLSEYYPSLAKIGLDVAITNDSIIRIIEANLNPATNIITRGTSRNGRKQ